ncbi:MAG: glycoside hydrolase family 95 protein [Ruminococcus sp.]|nr:glycoside hydrolase family 95 protein [Ruminococcus sp.]
MKYVFDSKTLWYDRPAEDWNDALPVGNGRIGGMSFGQPLTERIQLNEDSLWSGGPRNRNNPSALENLQRVRDLLRDEKIDEAEKLVSEAFCGTPINQRHYMPLGELYISHYEESTCGYSHRSLSLRDAVCTAEYSINGVDYKRELICSAPDQVLALRICASEKASVSVKITIDGRDDYFDCNSPVSSSDIVFAGGEGGRDGISFAAHIKVIGEGGQVRAYGNSIITKDCDRVTLLLGAHTTFRTQDPRAAARFDVESAAEKGFDKIMEDHIADYRTYFDRVSLTLQDDSGGSSAMPTNERLAKIKEGGKDSALCALYFDFGRYLMIAGSREGTLPLNLQGIWNKDMWPAWGCKYTVNINTEMNYWPAEVCALPELHMPLLDHIERMRPNGRVTAKEMYGCQGFVCHHNTDIWGDTAPQDLWIPGTQWPMGAAWLCLHIWEHYLFTLDEDLLMEKYPTMKEAAVFFTEFLTENHKGQLITSPSVSPENTYITKSGAKGSVCMGPTMDSMIVFSLFDAVMKASEILDVDEEFRKKLGLMKYKLPKPEIGKYGQIMEWAEDYDEAEPGHRHISQLFGLYPGDLISVRKTPLLAKAARATLERRLSYGGGHTGWSRAWIINHWARLWDGQKVEENITALLAGSTSDNLFDMHPPFQIDGNFGGTAGIAEALLQSGGGELVLLPALPPSWKNGEFRGLRARGGFEVSCKWENGLLKECQVIAHKAGVMRIVYPENVRSVGFKIDNDKDTTVIIGENMIGTYMKAGAVCRCGFIETTPEEREKRAEQAGKNCFWKKRDIT